MPKKSKIKPDDAKQSQQFVETARKLKVDENGKAFEKALKKISPKVSEFPKSSGEQHS